MNFLGRSIVLSLMAISTPAQAQVTPSPTVVETSADAAAFQKKAAAAQARICANQNDLDLLKRAIKLNEVSQARSVLLRTGFTAEDLENAKITLWTGGGNKDQAEIEISATCCDPKQITIQRTLDYFTK